MLYKAKFKNKPPAGWARHTVWNVQQERVEGSKVLCLIGKTWILKDEIIVQVDESPPISFKRKVGSLSHNEAIALHDTSLLYSILKQSDSEGLRLPNGERPICRKLGTVLLDSLYIRVEGGVMLISSFVKPETILVPPEKFVHVDRNTVLNDDSESLVKHLARLALSERLSIHKKNLIYRVIADSTCDRSHYKLLIEALKTV